MKSTQVLKVRAIRLACLTALIAGGMTVSTSTLAANDSAITSADIIAPIAITKVTDLAFGKYAAGTGGTVTMTTGGARSVSSGNVVLSVASSHSTATFTVGGEPSTAYGITLPATVTLTNQTGVGGETMSVGTITSNPATNGLIAGGGTQTLAIGAILTVGNAQVPGNYTGSLSVTVEYN
jgi:hypothetical protein